MLITSTPFFFNLEIPPRSGKPTTKQQAATFPFNLLIKLTAAIAVPPVAIRSSTTSI